MRFPAFATLMQDCMLCQQHVIHCCNMHLKNLFLLSYFLYCFLAFPQKHHKSGEKRAISGPEEIILASSHWLLAKVVLDLSIHNVKQKSISPLHSTPSASLLAPGLKACLNIDVLGCFHTGVFSPFVNPSFVQVISFSTQHC